MDNQGKGEILVQVEHLSKKFCKDLRTSLWYGLKDLYHNITGNKDERLLREKEFWALQDIDFELRRGECLGLIGHNGAGKSTLLKILNGLINPDAGRVTMKGRIGALIELGAGFNPILSGRENIYNNGAILGLSRLEIKVKFEEIVAFAELGEFIDMPVQNYSSGMKVRLGFAVAAQMQPDVLLIDEVLAVGDLGFTLKCFKTIDAILPNTAMVFVSHSMPIVSRVCTKIMLMDKGKVQYYGTDVAKGIDLYYSRFNNNDTSVLIDTNTLALIEARVTGENGPNALTPKLEWGSTLEIYFKFKLLKGEEIPFFFFILIDKEQRPVATLNNNDENSGLILKDGFLEFKVRHEVIELSKGIYTIDLIAQKTAKLDVTLSIKNIASFQIMHESDIYPPFY
ncbi:lipopolysaccharide transport system ATP-binding protein [Flavobacteriaceae bacterium MAR_2010_188]|nr:lipopolysaccharide transport system ATP-binding protein [Flavobacteriaceae bacterium MAR_2010_188]